MTLSAEQLKNLLVSYFVSSWRSNGTIVTQQEMTNEGCHWDAGSSQNDGNTQTQTRPYVVYRSLENSTSVLRLRCDDSAPKTAELQARYRDLRAFMVPGPLLAEMNVLLDQDIERDGLIEWHDSKPLSELCFSEKVQLLARHNIKSFDAPLPPTPENLIKLRICLLQVSAQDKMEFKYHQTLLTGEQGTHKLFLSWLDALARSTSSVAPDESAASSNSHSNGTLRSLVRALAQGLMLVLRSFVLSNKEVQERDGWSYKKLITSGKTPRLTGEWLGLKSEEDFERLLRDCSEGNGACPALIRTPVLEERRTVYRLTEAVESDLARLEDVPSTGDGVVPANVLPAQLCPYPADWSQALPQ